MEGQAVGAPLPTTDGLCLLALLRAAQLPGGDPLRSLVQQSALTMYDQYVTRPLATAGPHPETLHFAGYGLLALGELQGTGWPEAAAWAGRVHELGQWLLASGALDDPRQPRGDLLLGLAAATAVATRTQDADALASLQPALDRQLARRCAWQVAGPLEGPYLAGLKNRDPMARGGVLVAPEQPLVSVEPTLHYLQALLIAGRLPRSAAP
jgi:hypothetical protein